MTDDDAPMSAEDFEANKVTLLSGYSPPLLSDARRRQDEFITTRFKGGRYRIADLGCGDGYHGLIFGPASAVYHGYEFSPQLAEIARKRWHDAGIRQADLIFGDLANATPPSEFYDLVFCLYFTAGNFRDIYDDLGVYTDAYLDRNPAFVRIFTTFYRALKTGGLMFLTIYRDVPEAETEQRDMYENTGQHVLTPAGSRFVATREKFWSVRFTVSSLVSNLAASGVPRDAIAFHDLNSIAWLIEVSK